jgi:hypothetical protein
MALSIGKVKTRINSSVEFWHRHATRNLIIFEDETCGREKTTSPRQAKNAHGRERGLHENCGVESKKTETGPIVCENGGFSACLRRVPFSELLRLTIC